MKMNDYAGIVAITDFIRKSFNKKWAWKKPPFGGLKLVENTGIEPVTSCMPCKRSTN